MQDIHNLIRDNIKIALNETEEKIAHLFDIPASFNISSNLTNVLYNRSMSKQITNNTIIVQNNTCRDVVSIDNTTINNSSSTINNNLNSTLNSSPVLLEIGNKDLSSNYWNYYQNMIEGQLTMDRFAYSQYKTKNYENDYKKFMNYPLLVQTKSKSFLKNPKN